MRYVLMLVVVVAGVVAWGQELHSGFEFGKDGTFTMIQITDGHEAPKPRVAKFLSVALEYFRPGLLVMTGDNVGTNDKGAFEKAAGAFIDIYKQHRVPFAVTFGNHDSEHKGENRYTRDELYEGYRKLGGELFVDFDVKELSGTGSGVLPLRVEGEREARFNIFVVDSGDYVKGGYGGVKGDQIKWYEEVSGKVPCIWLQHIIVPDVYETGILSAVPTNTPECVHHKKGEFFKGVGYVVNSRRAEGLMKEPPCPTTLKAYSDADHTYEGRTLYQSWVKMGNMKGAFFGHDHMNTFEGVDRNKIRLGFTKAVTLGSYNDNNPGLRLFIISKSGEYTMRTVTEADLKIEAAGLYGR